jgi:hypothetical protein
MSRTYWLVAVLSAGLLMLAPGCGDDERTGDDSSADTDSDSDTDTDTNDECTGGVWDDDYVISDTEDLAALNGYTEVTGSLAIIETDLANLDGLGCLTTVGGNMNLDSNYDLININGLNNLAVVSGHFWITDNNILADLYSLGDLAEVGGNCWITGNDALTSLAGLNALGSLGGELWIGENESLTSVNGLESVSSIPGHLLIIGNPVLDDLNGMSALTIVEDLAINTNEELPDCEVCDILDQLLGVPDTIDVHDNLADDCTPVPNGCP